MRNTSLSYSSLHDLIKKQLPKPDSCPRCGSDINIELTNISEEYREDLSDWEWLCKSCHMNGDGRIKKMIMGKQKFKGQHMHTTNIIMTREQYDKLRKISFDTNESISELIRQAIQKFLIQEVINKVSQPYAPKFIDIKKEDIADGIELDGAAVRQTIVSKWPTSKYGKPLSGRTAKCDTCYELCPIEFAQEHYQKEHGDI